MLKKLKCVKCGKFYEIDVPTWLDQTSNLTTCPHCGNTVSYSYEDIWEEVENDR